jgi:hypothetical protein
MISIRKKNGTKERLIGKRARYSYSAFPESSMNRPESPPPETESEENWWDYCPICNAKLLNQKCKYVCSNPQCNFFMSCSEFDL